MKIVLVNTTLTGGAAIACRRLRKSLIDRLLNITLFSLQSLHRITDSPITRMSIKLKIFCKFIFERLHFIVISKHKKFRFAFSIANTGFDLTHLSEIESADIIHLHWTNQGLLSLKGLHNLFDLQKPIVWTLHDMWAFTGGCHYSGNCNHYMQECGNCMMLKNANNEDISHQLWKSKFDIFKGREKQITFIACSQWMRDKALESSLLKYFSVQHIPNTIDSEIFKPLSRSDSRLRFKLPEHKTLVLFGAANIADYRKGFEYLVAAVNILKSTHKDLVDKIEFVIFGKSRIDISPYFSPFKAHQVGTIISEPDMALLYNACNAFVTTSVEDNLPNTIIESLSCGTPVVGFNIGGIPEMIDHLENGYLADRHDIDSLCEALLWVQNDITEKEQKNARKKVLDNFAEEAISNKHLSLYHSLLAN